MQDHPQRQNKPEPSQRGEVMFARSFHYALAVGGGEGGGGALRSTTT